MPKPAKSPTKTSSKRMKRRCKVVVTERDQPPVDLNGDTCVYFDDGYHNFEVFWKDGYLCVLSNTGPLVVEPHVTNYIRITGAR